MIYGVSFDTVKENKAFADKFSFPFLLLCDTDRAIGLAYGAARTADEGSAKRISYLIGPDGSIAQTYGKVDVNGHPEQVLAHIG